MQVRLQQLVEGLSVVALSYYTLGLIEFLIGGVAAEDLGWTLQVILAIIVVPLVLAIWALVRSAKKRLIANTQ